MDSCSAALNFSIASMGSAFPAAPASFTVHSVYPSALNLSLGPGEPLCALVAEPWLAHPLAALVGAVEGRFSFDTLHEQLAPRRGLRGILSEGALVFENGLSFYLDGAVRKHESDHHIPAVRELEAPWTEACLLALDAAQDRSSTVLRLRDLGAGRRGSRTPLSRALMSGILSLDDAFRREHSEDALVAGLRLVGLGEGLTPTGDDFLVGWTAARLASSGAIGEKERTSFVSSWAQTLYEASLVPEPRTGEVSLSFLYLASRGLFSTALRNLAEAYFAGSGYPLSGTCLGGRQGGSFGDALFLLGRIGHSSGLDGATGFLFGLESEAVHSLFSAVPVEPVLA